MSSIGTQHFNDTIYIYQSLHQVSPTAFNSKACPSKFFKTSMTKVVYILQSKHFNADSWYIYLPLTSGLKTSCSLKV